jgi:hypothetical protein
MTQHATINDHVTYTPGDGVPLVIPLGSVEVDLSAANSATLSWTADNGATLSWTADNGAVGLTAIPLTQFNEYVRQKRITLAKK